MIRKILLILLTLITIKISAQRTSSSPYSFFGIGEEFSTKTVEQVSMGGIGVAYSSSYHLNFINPAANANLRYTTYAFGLLNNDLTIKDASGKQSSTSTSLSYFGFGVPIGRKAGISVGMQPISSVGYSLTNRVENTDGELTEITLFSGNGGVNRVYGSLGIMIFKGFSVGVEADFIFGRINNSILNQKANVQLATKYNQSSIVRGGSVKFGAQYRKEFKNKLRVDLGGAVKLSNDLSARGNEELYSLTISAAGGETPRDTLFNNRITGNFRLPIKTTVGLGLGKTNKWYAGIEYETQDAIDSDGYLNESSDSFAYDESSRISFGGFYLPKINSISSYWERITYRAGVRFEKTGLLVNGTSTDGNFTTIDDFGISFGLGLPLGNRLSNANVGFEFGKRGTTDNNLIQENYFNFRLSLSLTDLWFKKRQID